MRKASVLVACFLMVTGGLVVFAGAPRAAAPAMPELPGTGEAPGLAVGPADGPRDLVPPAPWSNQADPGPFLPLNRSRHPAPSPLTITGEAKVLAILVSFNDTSNSSSHTPTFFNNLLYNASSQSMNKFFRDNSYNMYNISGNVTTKFYMINKTMAYYGLYETWSPPPGGYGNSQDLTLAAVNAADADINYSEYDQDSDGYVDHLIIIHAGKDEASSGVSSDIWSHAWGLNAKAVKLDGKWINAYTMLSEDDPVGVFVHEFGHDLGLPDLYDTDYSSDGGCGDWEVMASGSWNNGGASPSMLGAWCRKELGWISPTVVNSDTAGIAASRIFDNQVAFKVWVNSSNNEYFLIENRQQTGWDTYLPGGGLLIWHVNESASGNTRDSYRLVDLEEWDNNNWASNANDAWKSNATGLTPTSTPNTNDYSGKKTDIRIYNISASGNTMYFDVDLGNTAPYAPTPTAPADGAWLGTSKPTVNWSFSDPDSGDAQTAFRLQVDGDSGFGSVDYDTGEVASTGNSHALGSALAEGRWYWRVMVRDNGALWSTYSAVRSFNIDLTGPSNPTSLTSSTHTVSAWSSLSVIQAQWSGASDAGSGLDGFSYIWDSSSGTLPDTTRDCASDTSSGSSGSLSDGTYYFHIRAVDKVGNWAASAVHLGPFYIDLTAPAAPTALTVTPSGWTATNSFSVDWTAPSESGTSGIATGAYYKLDSAPTGPTDGTWVASKPMTGITVGSVGNHTIYIWLRDTVGNVNQANRRTGYLPFDNVAPANPSSLSSSSHTVSAWSNLSVIQAQWSGASDATSGLDGFSYAWDSSSGTVPDTTRDCASDTSTASSGSLSDGTYYFHIRAVDKAGNWASGAVHLGPFYIDLTAPAAPTALSATPSGWTATNSFSIDWTAPSESGTSGIATGAYYKLDSAPTGATDGTWVASRPITGIAVASAGNHTIYVWLKDAAGNANHANRRTTYLYFDNVAPANPTALTSATHTVNSWSNLSVVQAQWSGASDADSGLDGFSYIWDSNANTLPDATKDCASDISAATSASFSDGTYYFHIRAVDKVGNWAAGAVHLGPFKIDLTPPGGVAGASSSSHSTGRWSNLNVVAVQWWGAADAGSGVGLYAYVWDRAPDTVPDTTVTLGAGVSTLSSPPLVDSAGWYFHIRVRDAVGNWNVTAFHFGPFDIDTTPPSNPDSYIVLSRHVVGRWSPDGLVKVGWSGHSDALSGVHGFSVSWDADPSGTAGTNENVVGEGYNETSLDGRMYLHIRAVDAAGNWAAATYSVGPFLIDLDPPSAPDAVAEKALTNSNLVRWSWSPATDAGSGVAYYVIWIVNDPARPQDGMQDLSLSASYTFRNALDGKTYHIQVRAVDAVGNAGQYGAFSSGTMVDLTPPRDVRLVINSGAALTGVPTVTLALSAADRVSGVADMRFSLDGNDWTAWAPFAVSQELALSPGDGQKTVWFQVRDLAGNEARPVRASIVLDTTGPAVTRFGQVGGSTLTAKPLVALEVSASDAHSRVLRVRLSPDGERWEPWQAYGPVLRWELSGGDGSKDIYVQARDAAGNVGPARKLSLLLDTTPPGTPVVTSPTHPKADVWYNLPGVQFDWQAPADASGMAGYAWILTPDARDEPGFSVQLTASSIKVPVPGEGLWHLKVRPIDQAGNCGIPASFSVRIDLTGPAPPSTELPADNWEFLPSDQISLSWRGAQDALSGVKGYYVQVDGDADYSSPEWEGLVDGTGYVLPALPEGSYYWHVKARDSAGNWGDYGEGSAFGIHTPVKPIPTGHKEPFLSLANPLFIVTLVVVLAAIGGGVAAAVRRRKKEPPAAEAPAPTAESYGLQVKWE